MSADILDVASDLTISFNKASEDAIRALVPKERDVAEDEVVECESCGNPVSTHRARLGYTVCLECARWEEQHTKSYRRSSKFDD